MTVRSATVESAFDGNVRAAEVHKQHDENVWLDRAQTASPYAISAVFRTSTQTASQGRLVDLIEVQRQIGMLQLARQAGLPESDVFILNQLSLRLLGKAKAPVEGTVYSHIVSAAATESSRRSFHQRFVFEAGDGLVAAGRSSATFIPHALYRRLRSGPDLQKNFMEAQTFAVHLPLGLNAQDPVLTDHRSDHVTAMQIVVGIEDALRRHGPRGELIALRLRFDSYVELAPQPMLSMRFSGGGTKFSGQVQQHGVARASFAGSFTRSDEAVRYE